MYQNNIYIQNHEEVAAMGGDIGVCLDKYDAKHGLARQPVASACTARATVTGVPELMSADDKKLLGL